MSTPEAQKRAKGKYMKEKTFRVGLEFYPPDKEIVEYLKTLDNKQGYIKQLIRDDYKNKTK